MAKLSVGDVAPAVDLPDENGDVVSLSDLSGRRVVVYFYPRDDTPGCTKEACQFSDLLDEFSTLDVEVLGISADSADKHRKFRAKYDLKVKLLTDAEHKVMEAYGAWGEKTNYGKTSMGVIRSTFLVGADGRIERAWYKVTADGHAQQVLERARELTGAFVPLDKPQWAELFTEVVTSGLCTGCAACVIACPHDVLGYDDSEGRYRPFHVPEDGGPADCTHGQRGCTLCTRACPRFRTWEEEADTHQFGRSRGDDEVFGVYEELSLVRATDTEINNLGQDGGLASAILIYALEHDVVDAALVSYLDGDGTSWKAVPGLARDRSDVLRAAGSRYTYSANPLAYLAAAELGAERLALVGMSCQASAPAILSARRAGKVARRFALTIGLMCSKTFDDAIFPDLFEAQYGLSRGEIVKMNIKGVFQLWMRDGSYHEVPLAEAHAFTREGCKLCPDFAAEHADISTGGIGAFADYTLTVVRTERGRAVMSSMAAEGLIESRPISDDPGAVTLLNRLSRVSRRRWPDAAGGPRRIPVRVDES